MPMLYLKCKTCKTEFASGIDFDRKSFEDPTNKLINMGHTCPKGHMNRYDKKDYYFK